MSKRFRLEVELPDDVVEALRGTDVATKAKESLVLELLREHCISQGKASELLGVNRTSLFPLMAKYQVPVVDLSADELQQELREPFPGRP